MKTKLLCCAMAFVGSLMMTDVYAQQAIVACNGKTTNRVILLLLVSQLLQDIYLCGQSMNKVV